MGKGKKGKGNGGEFQWDKSVTPLRNRGPFKHCGRVSDFSEKSITKMYGAMLLALPGGGWVSNFHTKKRY